jgi:hypothetical protein
MDLKIAWWNCRLSAPSTQASPQDVSAGLLSVILTMLDSGVDLLCLCEVNNENIDDLRQKLIAASVLHEEYAAFSVLSLYSKSGNRVDDYAIIFRSDKLQPSTQVTDLNAKADVTEKYLKIGRKLGFKLYDTTDIWVILCHWQSLHVYSEDSHARTEVGMGLRDYVGDIFDGDPDALIVICGDFNDEPYSRSIQMGLKASRDLSYVMSRNRALFNPFWRLIGVPDLVHGSHLPAGTCQNTDAQHMTNWRTFDQIILSSGFLKNGWRFVGRGVEILSRLELPNQELTWRDLSDHYPITCDLQQVL